MTPEQHEPRTRVLTTTLNGIGFVDGDMTDPYSMSVAASYVQTEPYSLSLKIWATGEYGSMRHWEVLREIVHAACAWGSDIAPPEADFSAAATQPGYIRLRFQNSDRHHRHVSYMDIVLSRSGMFEFINRTLNAVAPGTESQYLDIDALLAQLLAH